PGHRDPGQELSVAVRHRGPGAVAGASSGARGDRRDRHLRRARHDVSDLGAGGLRGVRPGGGGTGAAAGLLSGPEAGAGAMSAHVPVMLEEVIEALAPADGEAFVDGTFGAGGYARAI